MTREDGIVAYADGSGTSAHLHAGAGVAFYEGNAGLVAGDGDPFLEASVPLGLGTNNHAELSAVRIAIWLAMHPPLRGRPVILRCDSLYAIGRSEERGPVKPGTLNGPVIERIRLLVLSHGQVRFEHVRGHRKIPGNVRADKLAGMARLRGIARAAARSVEA